VVFIDFEGIGLGSRYQDLGSIFLHAIREEQPEIYSGFIQGYQSSSLTVDLHKVKQLAGIFSLAYVGFGLAFVGPQEAEKRMQIGLRLFEETSTDRL
jgi:hypothetical protein